MGIRHDDYDYGRINSLLERGLKSFIKLMTCYPERVSKKDFDGVMKGFTYSEKVSDYRSRSTSATTILSLRLISHVWSFYLKSYQQHVWCRFYPLKYMLNKWECWHGRN